MTCGTPGHAAASRCGAACPEQIKGARRRLAGAGRYLDKNRGQSRVSPKADADSDPLTPGFRRWEGGAIGPGLHPGAKAVLARAPVHAASVQAAAWPYWAPCCRAVCSRNGRHWRKARAPCRCRWRRNACWAFGHGNSRVCCRRLRSPSPSPASAWPSPSQTTPNLSHRRSGSGTAAGAEGCAARYMGVEAGPNHNIPGYGGAERRGKTGVRVGFRPLVGGSSAKFRIVIPAFAGMTAEGQGRSYR